MRSRLQTIDGPWLQADEAALAEAPLAGPYSGPKRSISPTPSQQILRDARNGFMGTKEAPNGQFHLVCTAAGRLAVMTDSAASDLAQICGEGLATFTQLMRFSRLALEADCTNLVSSADIVQRVHALATIFAQAIADARMQSLCDSGAMPQVLQERLDALVTAMTEAQSLCQETLGMAEELEQSIIASVEHSSEARARQKDIGSVIEQMDQTVRPIRAMATTCDTVQIGFSAMGKQARTSQQFALSTQQLGAAKHLLSIHGINALPADQYLPVARLAVLVRAAATQAGRALEDAVVAGLLNTDDLFDQLYYPVEGEKPQRYMTASTEFLRSTLPQKIQPLLATMPEIAWCACVDRNGYQPLWVRTGANLPPCVIGEPGGLDAAEGVILEDDAIIDAARRTHQSVLFQQAPHHPQATGTLATHHLHCEFFTPVAINGRHWGSLRIGFVLESTCHEPDC
jgi:hypothetical protein